MFAITIKNPAILLIASLSMSCAPLPDQIEPLPIASDVYKGMSCDELRNATYSLNSSLHDLTRFQQQSATQDMLNVAVLGIPTSKLTGYDRTKEIADVKGRLAAVEQELRHQRC